MTETRHIVDQKALNSYMDVADDAGADNDQPRIELKSCLMEVDNRFCNSRVSDA